MTALRSGIAVEIAKESGIIIGGVSVRLTLSEQVAETQLFSPIIFARESPLLFVISAIFIPSREVTGPLFPKNGGTGLVLLSLCTNSIPTVFNAVFSPSVAISMLKGVVAASLFVRSNKSPLKVVSIWKSGFF